MEIKVIHLIQVCSRDPSERSSSTFSRSLLDSLLIGFLPLFLILNDFHPALHPRGCASTLTPLSTSLLVVCWILLLKKNY